MKEENDKPTKERSHQEIILCYGLVRTWIMNYNCQFGIFEKGFLLVYSSSGLTFRI